jgi:hypothetical protein
MAKINLNGPSQEGFEGTVVNAEGEVFEIALPSDPGDEEVVAEESDVSTKKSAAKK